MGVPSTLAVIMMHLRITYIHKTHIKRHLASFLCKGPIAWNILPGIKNKPD